MTAVCYSIDISSRNVIISIKEERVNHFTVKTCYQHSRLGPTLLRGGEGRVGDDTTFVLSTLSHTVREYIYIYISY